MKILVTGADGMLGRAVTGRLSRDHEVRGVDLPDGDLTDASVATRLVESHGPEWIVHCAAWTDVDGAETARDASLKVNAGATAILASICGNLGCGLTYISTDYVFDGKRPDGYDEDDRRDPVNHYGLTKARGEESVVELSTPWQIVRTSWLFGDGPVNFVKTMRRLLGEREILRVVDDQRGSPTYTVDLAEILAFLVSGRHSGIFHGTNSGNCTWFDLARTVAELTGNDPDRIGPCPSSAYPTAAVRPACSILRSRRLEAVGCPERPSWRDAVKRYTALLESGVVAFP